MSQNISKVQVQKEGQRKSSKFDLTHDHNTSYGWGETQPLMCRLLPLGDTSNSFKFNTLVRLSPMTAPTFGRIIHRQYHQFVPLSDIYPNYKNTLSGVPTNFTSEDITTNFVDMKFPRIQLDTLMAILMSGKFASYQVKARSGNDVEENPWFGDTNLNSTRFSLFFIGQDTALMSRVYNFLNYYVFRKATDVGNEPLNPKTADFVSFFNDSGSDRMLLVKLSDKGRRLFKILNGLEITPSFTNEMEVSLLPLLAYYKAYFDLFKLPQYQNWETTNAYKLIKYMANQGSLSINWYLLGDNDMSGINNIIYGFFEDLAECWYTSPADFVSSHLSDTGRLPSVSDMNLGTMQVGWQGTDISASQMVHSNHGERPLINDIITGHTYLDQVSDELLKKMYYWVNKESQIGYDIKNRLLAKGYAAYVDSCESNFIGSTTTPITISDVTMTSETETMPLGSYTGKGVKYDESQTFSYKNRELGYIISIGVITPQAGYNSALNPQHLGLDKNTFYNPMFDSLGYEPTPRACIGHTTGIECPTLVGTKDDKTFGYIPRYAGWKVANNVLGGCFALGSEREQWSQYNLDMNISQINPEVTELSEDLDMFDCPISGAYASQSLMPQASQDWRYPTNKPWKGDFNRIFVFREGESQREYLQSEGVYFNPVSDNFLAHNIIEYTQYANMLPVGESFDTIDEESNAQEMTVTK